MYATHVLVIVPTLFMCARAATKQAVFAILSHGDQISYLIMVQLLYIFQMRERSMMVHESPSNHVAFDGALCISAFYHRDLQTEILHTDCRLRINRAFLE